MDFFQAQDNARKSTKRLVILFIFAVVSLIILTNILFMTVFGYLDAPDNDVSIAIVIEQFDWEIFFLIGIGVCTFIFCGSGYKVMRLSGGGKVVAESLSGQLVQQSTHDLNQRKLLNVVEEMALASGTPVSPVYLMADEKGINAFAAGFTPSDAVIGVTQGCIEQLDRDQLQGVIAHEFSHILNGDMRLNIRLIGVLHGILLLGIIGYFILRSGSGYRSSSSKKGGGIAVLGLGLLIIGYVGSFFGNWIKASLNRQREYLADASAVQFTRDPSSIAGALKCIGSIEEGSKVKDSSALEVSHAFFSEGISTFFGSLMATHPPLKKRIRQLDPRWDGKFNFVKTLEKDEEHVESEKPWLPNEGTSFATIVAVDQAMQLLNNVGQPNSSQLQYAQSLINEIPPQIIEAVHESYAARAIIYALILNKTKEIRDTQLLQLKNFGDQGIYELTLKFLPLLEKINTQCRLPLVDMSLPALKELSKQQYQLFKKNLRALISADSKVDLFEWTLQKILLRHLDAVFIKAKPLRARYSKIEQLASECQMVLSLLAYSGHTDLAEVKQAFNKAAEALGLPNISIMDKNKINLTLLNKAIDRLALLKPLIKPQLLKACLECIVADQKTTVKELELMRAISDALDCPMPPIPVM